MTFLTFVFAIIAVGFGFLWLRCEFDHSLTREKLKISEESRSKYLRAAHYYKNLYEQAAARSKPIPASNWRSIFGFSSSEKVSREMLDSRYKKMAMLVHPDRGGDKNLMVHINTMRDQGLKELTK